MNYCIETAALYC